MAQSRPTLLFSGHMTDDAGRPIPRFPEDRVPQAAEAIAQVLRRWSVGPQTRCICGGARGGDLLFAQAALALGAPLDLYLPMDLDAFRAASMDTQLTNGIDWSAWFAEVQKRATELSILGSEEDWPGDNVFAKNNLRMLHAAQSYAQGPDLGVLLLWNGQAGDGPGGTADMAAQAQALGARLEILDPSAL